MTSEAYKEAVLQAKEHILAGDIFQMVLSQLYRRQTLADSIWNIWSMEEILNDEKQCAEHIILVDMQRNNVKKAYS